MPNEQKPEKAVNNNELEVHSVFHTIQGEGPFSGRSAVFVRLSGCNLQCPGCDTDYTSKRTKLTPEALVEYVQDVAPHGLGNQLVVITGGEPFRQNIIQFGNLLLNQCATVQVETNGTLFPKEPDWFLTRAILQRFVIVCSPKTPTINQRLAPFINCYKYVIDAQSQDPVDGLPITALELDHKGQRVARPRVGFQVQKDIYIQPYGHPEKFHRDCNRDACVHAALNHGYILQLQIHKLIGVE